MLMLRHEVNFTPNIICTWQHVVKIPYVMIMHWNNSLSGNSNDVENKELWGLCEGLYANYRMCLWGEGFEGCRDEFPPFPKIFSFCREVLHIVIAIQKHRSKTISFSLTIRNPHSLALSTSISRLRHHCLPHKLDQGHGLKQRTKKINKKHLSILKLITCIYMNIELLNG